MFKVICIASGNWVTYYDRNKITDGPKYGDIDDVIEVRRQDGIEAYMLARFDRYFLSKDFIPLSDLDETIIHQETLLQTIK